MCAAGLQPGGATGKIPPHHAPLQRMNFGRPEAQTSGFSNVWWQARVVSLFAEHVVPMWFGNVALLCGGLGAVALVLGGPAARRTAGAGLLMAVVGGVLMLPPRLLGELIIASPARFFRAPWRFVVVTGFGTALLGAAALEVARERLPELANLGAAGWPVAMAGADTRYTVELVARWRRGADAGAVARIPLARDVPAGERLAQRVALSAPAAPGPYRLELAVEQVGGTRLSGPAAVLDLAVDVVPPG